LQGAHNIYIERFWRSFKREEFYLNAYSSIQVLRSAICVYMEFYNHKRWHQSLDYKTPAEIYFGGLTREEPVEQGTRPSDQPSPFGAWGQTAG
jgi:hypothetical protein